jgi:LuxR family maltose regulon positive regulatory protein
MRGAILVERIRLGLDEHDPLAVSTALADLEGLASRVGVIGQSTIVYLQGYLSLGHAMANIASGSPAKVIDELEPVLSQALAVENRYFAVRVGTFLAIAELALGREEAAFARFLPFLEMSSEAGLIRSIIDCGPEVRGLLAMARRRLAETAERSALAEYVSQLQLAVDAAGGNRAHDGVDSPAVNNPLSPREAEVLRLVAQGQSNKRIAAVMSVSPETVKSYIKNVFLKLGVDNRMRAVTEGRRLKLLVGMELE